MRLIDAEALKAELLALKDKINRAPGRDTEYAEGARDALLDAANRVEAAPVIRVEELLALADEDARLLTFEDIRLLPEGTLIWGEHRMDWNQYPDDFQEKNITVEFAPMIRSGDSLEGTGWLTEIEPGMLEEKQGDISRYWLGRPSEEKRRETEWSLRKR